MLTVSGRYTTPVEYKHFGINQKEDFNGDYYVNTQHPELRYHYLNDTFPLNVLYNSLEENLI